MAPYRDTSSPPQNSGKDRIENGSSSTYTGEVLGKEEEGGSDTERDVENQNGLDGEVREVERKDLNIVDWDGPDDPVSLYSALCIRKY